MIFTCEISTLIFSPLRRPLLLVILRRTVEPRRAKAAFVGANTVKASPEM